MVVNYRASITEGGKEGIFFDYGSKCEEESEVLFDNVNLPFF